MIRFFAAIVLLLGYTAGFSQDLTELEKRHGFKDIRLDMPVDSVTGAKLKKEIKEKLKDLEYNARLFAVENPDYAQIGEVKVSKIELKTYKDIIYEICVVADKDPRLMKALESLYGKASYDMKSEMYFWKTPTLILTFKSADRSHLQLVYTSFNVHKTIKEDKDRKVDDIANDF
jgi:hypothetical protein